MELDQRKINPKHLLAGRYRISANFRNHFEEMCESLVAIKRGREMQKERGPAIEAPFLFDELRMIHAEK